MTDQKERHVFISYVRENQKQVDQLARDLKSHGVNVWLDRNSIKPGTFWNDAIRKAIRDGTFFIACFSKEYNEKTSTHMNEELNLAIEVLRKRPREQAWFIPMVLSGDVPDWEIFPGKTLQDIQWVPLYENWHDGIRRILSVIAPRSSKIHDLINQLNSNSARARVKAADNLGKIGPSSKVAVPALIHALKDEQDTVRGVAAWALGMIGLATKEVIYALLDSGEHHPYGDYHASEAIVKLGKPAVMVLTEALRDQDKNVRYNAAYALAEIGPEAKSALLEVLKDGDRFAREDAAWAMGHMGPEAKAAVPALIVALKDEDKHVRYRAEEALEKINTPEAQKALEEYNKQKSD